MNHPSTTHSPINITVEHKPGCLVVLQVEVNSELAKAEHEKAIKEINKEVSLPGFRKGRAPRDYMLANFKSHIERKWQDNLANVVFNLVLDQTHLYPIDRNSHVQCNWKTCSLEDKSQCVFEYEVMPDVPTIDYTSLKIEVPPKTCVCDHEIEKELGDLARRYAHWEDVERNHAQEGEWVELEALDETGVSLYLGKRFEVLESAMPKDLYDLISKVKAGEPCSAKLKRPGSDEIVDVSVTLHKILKRVMAPMDDSLAKVLGLENMAALKARIEKNLSESSEYDYRRACFEAIQKALGDTVDFDVPTSTLAHEERMQENSWLSQHGKSEEEMSEEERKLWKTEAHALAKGAVRQTFLLHKIASEHGVKIVDHEVHELMRPFLHELEKEKDQDRLRQRFQMLYGRCRMHLVAERALEHVAKSLGLI